MHEADRQLEQLPDRRKVPEEQLSELAPVVRREMLRRLILFHGGIGVQRVSSRQIALAEHLLSCPEDAEVTLSGGLTVYRTSDALIFQERGEAEDARRRHAGEASAHQAGEILPVRAVYSVIPRQEAQKIPSEPYTKWFDYDKITNDIVFRTRQSGDKIVLAGVGTKSVRRYMIDEKIPVSVRDRIPVLAMGSQILWIVGYRMSAAFQITEETESILQVTVHLPENGPEKGKQYE